MKTLDEIRDALARQKQVWLGSTTNWMDFDVDFEVGNRKHRESIEFDFLTENDVVDVFTPELSDDIGVAEYLRRECLFDTLQALDLI